MLMITLLKIMLMHILTDESIAKNVNACANTDDPVKNHVDARTNENKISTNENENENK